MTTNLSLDEQVSFLAGSLKGTLSVAVAVMDEGSHVDEWYSDAAHKFILAYGSFVSGPRVPDFEFRAYHSRLMEWAGRNSAIVKSAKGERVGCLFFMAELLFGWMVPRKSEFLSFDGQVYVKAFEQLREEKMAYAAQ